jgi:hypothetical protein
MSSAADPLRNLRVAAPCPADWNAMPGDDRVRHCTLCDLNVYNFETMTSDEVRALLMRTEGRVCGRMVRRADGTLLTRDCPTGLRALRRRASRMATAAITAMLTFSGAAFGRTTDRMRVKKNGSKVKIEVVQASAAQPATFQGTVESDGPLPGATVTITSEATRVAKTIVTDADGRFALPGLESGEYSVTVELSGLRPAVITHLLLKTDHVTTARISMKVNACSETVLVGAVGPEPMDNGISTTFGAKLINDLPLRGQ